MHNSLGPNYIAGLIDIHVTRDQYESTFHPLILVLLNQKIK